MTSATEHAPVGPGGLLLPHGRRERKKDATRASLVDAAYELFADGGFEHTTVEDITERADVAQRTFFRYFGGKEQVVLGAPAVLAERLAELLRERPQDAPLLEHVLAATLALDADGRATRSAHGRDRLRLRFQISDRSPEVRAGMFEAYRHLELCLAEYVAEQTGRSVLHDTYPLVVGAAVTACLRVGLATWVARDCVGDVNDVFLEAVAVVRSGLAAPTRGEPDHYA